MLGYIDDMPGKLAACDLMICRAGALSLAEVVACGKPAIIIACSYRNIFDPLLGFARPKHQDEIGRAHV